MLETVIYAYIRPLNPTAESDLANPDKAPRLLPQLEYEATKVAGQMASFQLSLSTGSILRIPSSLRSVWIRGNISRRTATPVPSSTPASVSIASRFSYSPYSSAAAPTTTTSATNSSSRPFQNLSNMAKALISTPIEDAMRAKVSAAK